MIGGLVLVFGISLIVVGFAIVGHLQRIAEAIEAQNRAYGVADESVEKRAA